MVVEIAIKVTHMVRSQGDLLYLLLELQNMESHLQIPGRKSFFWNGVLNCLPIFISCITPEIQDGGAMLFLV